MWPASCSTSGGVSAVQRALACGQRAAKAGRKAGARQALAAGVSKSLHKSTAAFTPDAGTAPADPGRPAARGITDLFNQQQRRGA